MHDSINMKRFPYRFVTVLDCSHYNYVVISTSNSCHSSGLNSISSAEETFRSCPDVTHSFFPLLLSTVVIDL